MRAMPPPWGGKLKVRRRVDDKRGRGKGKREG
jgi:hypothetical protein